MELIKTADGAHDPALIYGLCERLELFCERSVTKARLFEAGSEFKKIGEQAVEDGNLIFEGRITIFGEGGGVGEKLGETLAAGGALEDAEGVATALGSGVHVHFEGKAGAAFGELGGELDFRWFAGGLLFKNIFDVGLRERGEIELKTTRDDGGEKRVRRRRRENESGTARRLFENLEKDVGDVPAHGFCAVEYENAAAAHRLEVSGALDRPKLADAEHGTGDGILQANGVGNECPDIGMRLENERDALDSGGIGALAALRETLF